jgi:uncharacterized protein (DUF1778 family)
MTVRGLKAVSSIHKVDRLNLRANPQERELLERAAQLEGKTLSRFMLEASKAAAETVLRRTQTIMVNLETYRRFRVALETEPQVSPRLLAMLERNQQSRATLEIQVNDSIEPSA